MAVLAFPASLRLSPVSLTPQVAASRGLAAETGTFSRLSRISFQDLATTGASAASQARSAAHRARMASTRSQVPTGFSLRRTEKLYLSEAAVLLSSPLISPPIRRRCSPTSPLARLQ